jgi:hypothetical protein
MCSAFPNSRLEDGLPTSSDVVRLKLNADRVVLSACNAVVGDKSGARVPLRLM